MRSSSCDTSVLLRLVWLLHIYTNVSLLCERSLESGDLSYRPRPAITGHVSQLVTGLSLGVVATAAAARRRPLPCPCPVQSIPCIQPLLPARSTHCGPSTVGKRLSRGPPYVAHSQSTSGPGCDPRFTRHTIE